MRVLISGAGIAGPTLAWFLAKAGFRITVVEKSPALLPHGQNIDVNGSALTVIKKMGLLSELRRFNTTEKGTQLINPQGHPIAPFPVRPGSDASPTSEFEILRGDLAALLHRAAENHPNIDYKFSTTVKRILSNDASGVTVELSNGETATYALLTAADGQWSRLRASVFPPSSITVADKGSYAVYWTAPRTPTDTPWWSLYHALRSRILSTRPDPHGTTRACLSIMPCSAAQKREWQAAVRADRKTQEELVRRDFADAGWEAERLLGAMGGAEDFYFQAIQQIKMERWSEGRVVCLGDAAFAPTPLTGGGASLAIVGAYVLAGELSRMRLGEGESPAKALEAYERKYRPFVEKMQHIPWFVPGIVHPKRAWGRWMLQAWARAASRAVETNWLRRSVGGEGGEEYFPLPEYEGFGEKR